MAWFAKFDTEERNETLQIAKGFSEKLKDRFGIAWVQDHKGEHGPAGAIYLTLRHTDKDLGDCHITMQVTNIDRGMV